MSSPFPISDRKHSFPDGNERIPSEFAPMGAFGIPTGMSRYLRQEFHQVRPEKFDCRSVVKETYGILNPMGIFRIPTGMSSHPRQEFHHVRPEKINFRSVVKETHGITKNPSGTMPVRREKRISSRKSRNTCRKTRIPFGFRLFRAEVSRNLQLGPCPLPHSGWVLWSQDRCTPGVAWVYLS